MTASQTAARRSAPETVEGRIRPGVVADIPQLVEIEARCFATDRLSKRSFQHLLTRGHTIHLVAEVDGVIVGYVIVLLQRGTSLARLYSFAIDAAYRGRGIGMTLLAETERHAVEKGCAFMRLEVRPDNAVAIARYRAAGYKEFGSFQDFYEDHSDALRMEKVLAGTQAPKLAKIPFFPQTVEFTCGPAALMMAMKGLDPALPVNRALEMRLWRESTTIYMTNGHGGCGPYGMALAALHRGFDVEVRVNEPGALFVDSVRNKKKREVIRLVEQDFREQAAAAGVPVNSHGLTVSDLVNDLQDGAVPIVLISSYHLYGRKAPHWVVLTGYDDRFLYMHDPYIDPPRNRTSGDSMNVPVTRRDFDRMARYGGGRVRAAVIVKRRPPA